MFVFCPLYSTTPPSSTERRGSTDTKKLSIEI